MSKRFVINNAKISRNKTTATAIVMVLMLTTSAALMSIPNVNAKTSFALQTNFYPLIGVNSATAIMWIPSPNIFLTDPAYAGKTSVWANATVTFTRPDGTKDVVNGPITLRGTIVGGFQSAARLELIYTPNMMGNWTVSFYWPGDNSYNAVNQTDTFTVGEPIGFREVSAY